MSSSGSVYDDEEFARRLQFEEQSNRIPTSSRHGTRNPQQHIQDMEVSRQYAQMDLDHSTRLMHLGPGHGHGRGESLRASPSLRKEQDNFAILQTFSVSAESRLPLSESCESDSTLSKSFGNQLHFEGSAEGQEHSHIRKFPPAFPNQPNPFDYTGGLGPFSSVVSNVGRRISRSQSPIGTSSPTESPRGYRASLSDTSESKSLRQRPSSCSSEHEFLVRSGALQAACSGRARAETLPRRNSFATTSPTATTDPHLEFARHLQMLVFSDLAGPQNPLKVSLEADDDMKLAQKMQDLEDRGMGRYNSDRKLDVDFDSNEEVGSPSGRNKMPVWPNDESVDISRLIAESGANVDELSEDVLSELLGSDVARQFKLSSSDATKMTKEAVNNGTTYPTSPTIRALSTGFPGKDVAENRVSPSVRTTLAKSQGSPVKSPAKGYKFSPNQNLAKVDVVSAMPNDSPEEFPVSPSKQKKKRRGFLGFGARTSSRDSLLELNRSHNLPLGVPGYDDIKPPPGVASIGGIPAAIPPRPISTPGVISSDMTKQSQQESPSQRLVGIAQSNGCIGIPAGIPSPHQLGNANSGIPTGIRPKPSGSAFVVGNSFDGTFRGTNICSACGLTHGTFLIAFDRRYHPECFRCKSCDGRIDHNDQFKYAVDEKGRKHPHHRECFMSFGVKCTVCRQTIPAMPDGKVPYIKHPFFEKEEMCVRHADENHRRCCGCQRFEPINDTSFIDLMDGDRCVCPACCRTVVVDNIDVKPLWLDVLSFFESFLKLPVWDPMRDLPVLMIGAESLQSQMQSLHHVHASCSHCMTSGLCLTERSASLRDGENVVAILCLTGLPRDLAAGVLAHQAMHAWIKLNPNYDSNSPLPPQIEEGLCQLVAMLFLQDGLPPIGPRSQTGSEDGPSDEKLRQYFQFTIERDKNEIYGTGYRIAAMVCRDIGIEELTAHVLKYKSFPHT